MSDDLYNSQIDSSLKAPELSAKEREYLLRAISLAKKGYGKVSPNPYVGAVIVRDGEILGEGYHAKAGEAHAEVAAVKNAKANGHHNLHGATLYVTLEPCCFTGKTAACTDLLIKEGFAKVVTASEDPNPKVAGQGHKILTNAGIEVLANVMPEAAEPLLTHFRLNQDKQRPFVTLKAALSLDGKLATQTRDSQWITIPEARKAAHYLRGLHDGILIGKGTLLADNPTLNVRYGYETEAPTRILMLNSFTGISPEVVESFHFFNNAIAPTILLYPQGIELPEIVAQQLAAQNVELIPLTRVRPKEVLEALFERSIMSLFIEGGAAIYDAFISADLVDEYALFYGAKLIGSPNALELWRNSPVTNLSQSPKIEIFSATTLGEAPNINFQIRARRSR